MVALLLAISTLALCLSAFATPLIKRFACHYRILDGVESFRKIHNIPIPLCGGLGIAGSFIVMLLIIDSPLVSPRLFNIVLPEHRIAALLIGSVLMLMVGFFDDLRGLRAWHKFVLQWVISLIVAFMGVRIEHILLPFGFIIDLGYLSIPLSCFWMVGLSNAVNLIDGLDGLASGVTSIALFFLFAVNLLLGNITYALVCLALSFSVAGFLFFNFNPASIFLGDTGSLFIGFLVGILSIETFSANHGAFPIFFAMFLIAFPIFDTSIAIGRRFLQGRPIFSADKGHIHHKLLDLGYSQRQTVLTLYLLSTVASFLGLIDRFRELYAYIDIATVLLLTVFLLFLLAIGHTRLRVFVLKAKIKGKLLVFLDVLVMAASLVTAVTFYEANVVSSLPVSYLEIAIAFLVLLVSRIYTLSALGFYRDQTVFEAHRISMDFLKAMSISLIMVTGLLYLLSPQPLLVIPIVIEFFLSFILLGSLRVSFGLRAELVSGDSDKNKKRRRAIIVGSEPHCVKLGDNLGKEKDGLLPVGYITDTPIEVGTFLGRIQILGTLDKIKETVERYGITDIIVGDEAARGLPLWRLTKGVNGNNVVFHRFDGDKAEPGSIRPIRIEDFFDDRSFPIDHERIGKLVSGKVVMIADIGHGLGFELCRQLLRYRPSELVILGLSDEPVSQIVVRLREEFYGQRITDLVCSTQHKLSIAHIFSKYRPAVVFHTALFNNISIQEENACEAVFQNILGTKNLIEAADREAVEKFVFISTSKDIRAKNVVSATRRIAELLIQSRSRYSKTSFNIISLREILDQKSGIFADFSSQIEQDQTIVVEGGNFLTGMLTICEAAQLILHTASHSKGGDKYLLDGGGSLSVFELAEEFIRLKGLQPHRDVEIRMADQSIDEMPKTVDDSMKIDGFTLPDDHILVAVREEVNESYLHREIEELFDLAKCFKNEELISRLYTFVNFLGKPEMFDEKRENLVHT